MAFDCFHKYGYNFQRHHPPQQLVIMVVQSNSLHYENTWYVDNGVDLHVTFDIASLHLVEPYKRDDKLVVVNGSNGLQIKHTCTLTLHASNCNISFDK